MPTVLFVLEDLIVNKFLIYDESPLLWLLVVTLSQWHIWIWMNSFFHHIWKFPPLSIMFAWINMIEIMLTVSVLRTHKWKYHLKLVCFEHVATEWNWITYSINKCQIPELLSRQVFYYMRFLFNWSCSLDGTLDFLLHWIENIKSHFWT